MGHRIDRCDIVDVLEESVTIHSPVNVELQGGGRYTDEVRDVVTEDGEDYAVFKDHGRVPVSEIFFASRAEPVETGYQGTTRQNR